MVAIKTVPITRTEAKVLMYLALNGPATGYTLGKETDISNRSAYTYPKALVDKGFLSVSVIGETRAHQDMKEYSLTILGLSCAFTLTRSEDWNPIIERWSHLLPYVLEKWDLFVNAGFWDLVWISLSLVAYDFQKNHWSDVELSKAVANELDESWRDELSLMQDSVDKVEKFQIDFYSAMFKLNRTRSIPKDIDRLAYVCKKDKEIRDWLVNGWIRAIVGFRSEIDSLDRAIQGFNRDDKVR